MAHEHHVRAEGVDQFASGVLINFYVFFLRLVDDPAHAVSFFHARKLHNAAILAQGFADALVAVFVLHLHAANVSWNADMVGDEDDHRVRVGIFHVGFNGGEFVSVRAAPVKLFDAAHKEHLKRRHERRRARAVQHFRNAYLREIKIMQAEVAHVRGDKMLQERLAALVAKENFVADEHIRRAQLAARDFRRELFCRSKTSSRARHQKASRMSPTSVRAKSCDMRCSAGVSSSKKLVTSRETWYCW